jgi:SAM-dependent methyltransferase
MKCTLCETEINTRFGFNYYDCQNCRALVKDTAFYPDPIKEREHYETHENDVNDVRYQKFAKPITDFVFQNLTAAKCGLDFGCGNGPVISKVLQDNQYQIAQYDPYFAPFPVLLEKQYDYIICCEVIEHFYNPMREFEKLTTMLREGGYLICMTLLYKDSIDFGKWFYRRDPTHVIIYRAETIKYIAATFPLSIEKMTDRLMVWKKGANQFRLKYLPE